MPTDDWGGVAVQDDWGGAPVDQKDDWGGVAVATPTPKAEDPFFTGGLPQSGGVQQLLAKADPTMGQYAGAAAIGESTSLDNPSIKTMDDITAAYTTPMIDLHKPDGTGIASGAARGAIKLIEGMTSPLNVALLGVGAGLPATAQKIAAGGFAADMASHVPEQYRGIQEAADEGNPALAAERAVETLGAVAMTAMAGAHAAGRPGIGGAERSERPPSLTQEAADITSTRKQIRDLKESIDQQPLSKEGQRPVVPETVDGLVLTRNRLARDFADQPENIQRDRQSAIDEIDDQLLRFGKDDVQSAEARVAAREVSSPPESIATAEQPTTGGPSTTVGRSSLFEQAKREAEPEAVIAEAAPEAPAAEAPAREKVTIDPEIAKVVAESAERIADQVTKGQPTMVREAARDAALANAMGSLQAGKQHSVGFMRKSAQTAAGEAMKKQGESLDAPVGEGETSRLDTEAAPRKVENTELYKPLDSVISTALSERDSSIVRAVSMDGMSMEAAGAQFGLSKQRVSQIVQEALPKLRKALEEQELTKDDYVGGPGAMGPIEALEMKLKSTGTKNETVAAEREIRGEDPILKEESVSNRQSIKEARQVLEKDPARADVIVEELNNSARDVRTISTADEAVLMARKVDLMRQRTEQETIYGSGDATPEQRAIAAQELTAIETKLNALDQATYASGAEWGRMGQLRQRLLRQDYSLKSMERKARIQKGESLTPEERTKIKQQSEKIQELTTKLEEIQKSRDESSATKASEESFSDIVKRSEESPESKFSPRVLALAESIVTRLDKAADTARQRIRDRLKNASAGLDPTVVYDVAVIGVSKLARKSLDFAKWSAEMTSELGDWVKPYLADAWKESDKLWKAEEKRLNPADKTAVERVRTKRADAADKAKSIETLISERAKGGDKPEDLRGLVQRLALETVRAGEKTREGLLDKVHTILQKDFPDLQKNQTRDLISGYGKFKSLDKDAAKTTLRELKGEMQQIGKIEDMQAKQAPKKTGVERRTPSDEERRLIKEVNELKKKGGFEVVDPEKQLKTSLDAIKTRLNNEIRDLDTAIATGERITPKKNVVQRDAETKALQERRDAKKAEYDQLFPKEPLTDAQLLDRAGKALDRSISELEGDLKSGRLYGDKNTRKLTSPEIDAKRARLEALRTQRDELRAADTATIEARALKSYKTRTANRIAELQDKIAKQDFAPKVKRDLKLDAEALDLKAKIETVKEKYNEDLLKHKLAKRTMGQKIIGGISETVNTARAILTSFDFSAVLRQGGFTSIGNPVRAARALPDMFKSFVSENAQKRVNAEIQSRPNADLYQKAKLHLSDVGSNSLSKMEEAYMSRWAKKIPLVAGSERAYVTFLNKIRADTFDALVKSLGDKNGVSLDEAKAIANFVNVSTGRGGLGKFETSGNFLSTIFFSPRYVASRFQLMAGSPMYGGSMRTRTAIAKEYSKFLTGIGLIYAMGKLAGATVEEDPRSSDFGKLKMGNTRIDPMGGILQNTVLLSRIATGETKQRGNIVAIRGDKVPFKGDSTADVMARFARTKFSPLIGAGVDLASGQNVMGQKATPVEVAKNFVIPMSLKDVHQNMVDQGVPTATAQLILSLFGLGIQNYGNK